MLFWCWLREKSLLRCLYSTLTPGANLCVIGSVSNSVSVVLSQRLSFVVIQPMRILLRPTPSMSTHHLHYKEGLYFSILVRENIPRHIFTPSRKAHKKHLYSFFTLFATLGVIKSFYVNLVDKVDIRMFLCDAINQAFHSLRYSKIRRVDNLTKPRSQWLISFSAAPTGLGLDFWTLKKKRFISEVSCVGKGQAGKGYST